MTPVEREILQALIDLDAAAKTAPKAGGAGLPALLARLDELTRRLPADTAPDLLHYLHRQSYQKARLWLEGHGAENARGDCRHG